MTQQTETTPIGRRSVLLCQIAAQTQAGRALEAAAKPGANQPAAVNKWTLSRTLAEIKDRLGVSDRSFSVLNALLSFQPETALSLHAQNDGEDAEGQVLRAERGRQRFPRDQITRGISARADGESAGWRVCGWAYPDGADRPAGEGPAGGGAVRAAGSAPAI